jgi:hypothetical protein
LQQPLKQLQHPLIYFCNIYIKQLQHTSETAETLETYICDIGKGKRLGWSIPVVGFGDGDEQLRVITITTGTGLGSAATVGDGGEERHGCRGGESSAAGVKSKLHR